VDTPLLGYVWQKGGPDIDIIPVLANEHTLIGYNPYLSIERKKFTKEVRLYI
jgi:hypothetical protein